MSSSQPQEGLAINDLKQKLKDDFKARRINRDSIANARLTGDLGQLLWSTLLHDRPSTAFSFQKLFMANPSVGTRHQHMQHVCKTDSAMQSLVQEIVEAIASVNVDLAAQFMAVLEGSYNLGNAGSSRASSIDEQGRSSSRSESVGQSSHPLPHRKPPQQFQYDPSRGIDPQQTLLNAAGRYGALMTNDDPYYGLPELQGSNEFIREGDDDENDGSGKGNTPAGTGRPFGTWSY